jgi:hypothetical protein
VAGKIRASEGLALGAALVLFLTTLMPWFSLPGVDQLRKLAPTARAEGGGSLASIDLNIWDLGFARWFIYIAILLGVCMFLAALFSRNPEWSIILATPLVIFSLIAMLSLLVRLVDSPRPYADATGWFYLAVASSVVLFGAACWAIRDESVPEGFDKAPRPEMIHVEP